MPDTNGKYVKMKKFIDKINELEKTRTELKKQLRGMLSNPLISINSMIENAVGYQKRLARLSARIQNLHRLYNQHWFGLTYEEKVRYRYWANGEEFPGFVPPELEQQPETPSDRPEDQNVPSNESDEWKASRRYFKIDRANAQKLCGKLIEFLSGQDEYFKVGFDETHSG